MTYSGGTFILKELLHWDIKIVFSGVQRGNSTY